MRKKRDGEEGEGERIERLPWNSGNRTFHWGILLEALHVNPWQSRSILYGTFLPCLEENDQSMETRHGIANLLAFCLASPLPTY